jgi:hypothetical protein
MRRRHQYAPAIHVEEDFRNLLICPEDVIVAVGNEPGRLALIHPKPSLTVREGDMIRATGKLYQLAGFVCSMGFHRDEVQVYRITEVDG